jgi:hypothetical protein
MEGTQMFWVRLARRSGKVDGVNNRDRYATYDAHQVNPEDSKPFWKRLSGRRQPLLHAVIVA